MKNIIHNSYLLILIASLSLGAQNLPLPRNIQSPTASNLGRYGDNPVSLYTGRVDVNVPVFETTEYGIPLKIDFSYDASGVRVNDMPSWIGQNWSMNAGGVITRTEKGNTVDEFKYRYETYPYGAKGYYYKTGDLNVGNWSDTNYLWSLAAAQSTWDDLEPDIFTFNFLGIYGKFFLGHDGQWKVQSNKNLKVIIDINDNLAILDRNTIYPWQADPADTMKCFGKITLVDDDGNQYVFGGSQTTIEYCQHDFFDYKKGVVANAWYLAQVKNRLGQIVYTFEYERAQDFQAHFYLSYFNKLVEKSSQNGFFHPGGGCLYSKVDDYSVRGTLSFPVYLKKITTSLGYVINFNRSNSDHVGFNRSDNLMLTWTLNQWDEDNGMYENIFAYNLVVRESFYLFLHDQNEQWNDEQQGMFFHDFLMSKIKNTKLDNISIKMGSSNYKTVTLQRNPTTERLNLVGLTMNNDNSQAQNYRFEYKNFAGLPSLLSDKMDHWGFYTGTSFYPIQQSWILHQSSREANAAYVDTGALTKITYPTGGYSQYEYELHSYAKYVNHQIGLTSANGSAGGLRIKKITTNDGTIDNVREFKYSTSLSGTGSSGILMFKNTYHWPDWYVITTANAWYREVQTSLNSVIPLGNFSGPHISYSKVYEIQNSGSGHTLHEFTDYVEYPDVAFTNTISLSHSAFDAKNSNDFKRGLPKKTSYFSAANSTTPVRTIQNTYATVGTPKKARAFDYEQYAPCIFSGDGVLIGNAYEIEYSDFRLTSTTETNIFPSGSVAQTKNYTNANYPTDNTFFGDSFVTSESTTNSLNQQLLTDYQYIFNFTGTTETNMLTQHYLPLVETRQYRAGSPIIKSKNIFTMVQLSVQQPMLTSIQKAKSSEPYEDHFVIDKYDNKGNILQYHEKDGMNVSYIYNSSNQPIYKMEGATYQESYPTINGDYKKRLTTYIYDNFKNLSFLRQPSGITEKYIYDLDNRLIKITNGTDKVLKKFEYNIR